MQSANSPAAFGVLVVLKCNSYVFQLFLARQANVVYMRSRNHATGEEWREWAQI